MISNNKILTVSYGTFSCTLEGFDDSFGTMKAIAEYFRDLAADDRYFGAEPPQPDAEMLARIAEREISRRVQAREQEGRIVLSAEAPAASPAPATALPAAAPTPDADAPAAHRVAAHEDAASDTDRDIADLHALDAAPARAQDTTAEAVSSDHDDAVPAAVTEDATLAEAPAEDASAEAPETDAAPEQTEDDSAALTVTEPMDTIGSQDALAEDTAAELHDATGVADTTPIDTADTDDADTIAATITPETDAAEEAELADAEDAAHPATDEDIVDGPADAPIDADTGEAEPIEAEPIHTPEAPAPDSIAAKLQRIRAVVSQAETAPDDEPLFEDEHADDFAPQAEMAQVEDTDTSAEDNSPTDVAADAAQDIEAAMEADAEAEATSSEETEDDNVAAILARFDAADTSPEPEQQADTATVADDADAPEMDELSALLAEDADTSADTAIAQDTTEDAAVATVAEDATEEAPQDADAGSDSIAALLDEDTGALDENAGENLFEEAGEAQTAADQDDAERAEAPAQPVRRARVIKVKRADIDAAVASGLLEEISADADEDTAESSLSPQDEAELMAELAEVEAELPAEAPADTPADDVAATAEPAAEQTAEAAVKDDDVTRLMAEADQQMEEPEGSRRRNAFQHLKAAVLAKKADAGIGEDTQDADEVFRSDLAEAVRPRRPEPRGNRSERPSDARPAPLKLVAEQRVDTDAAPKGPVRPRRVAAMDTPAHKDGGSFADYASDMGAHDLPALLEAAASYLSFVEGHDQFSRPQLMTTVRQAESEEFSREDRLRSFGQLLRAGKIEKQKGGRFTVTEDIGYRPDQRAAG